MNSKSHYYNTKYQKPYNHKTNYQKHSTHKLPSKQYTDHTNSNHQPQYQNHKKQYNQQQNQQLQQQFQQQNQHHLNKNNINIKNNNNNYNKNININKQRLLTLQIENNLPTLQFTLTNISNIQSVTRDLCDDLLQSGSLQVYQVKNQCLQCTDIKLSNHYMASLVPCNPQVEKLMENQKLDENHIYVSLNENLNILIVFSHGDNQKLDPALEFQEEEVNIFCFRGFVTTQRGGDRYVNLFQNEDPTERLRINKTYDHVKKEFYLENKFNQQILQLQETKQLQKKHSVYEFKEKIFQEQLQRQKDNKNIIVIDDEQEDKMREFEKQLEQKKSEGDEYYQKKIKELLDIHNPDYVGYTDEEIFEIYKGHNDIAIGYLNLTLQKENELFDNYQKYLKQQIIQLDDEILHLKESIVFEQQDNFEKQEELQKLKFKLKNLIENKEEYKIEIQNTIQQSFNQLEQYQSQKCQQANEYFESLFQVKKNKLQQLKSVLEQSHQSKQQFEENTQQMSFKIMFNRSRNRKTKEKITKQLAKNY
ncbi:hypothetical protein PPERSA_08621 [Pseudocohnilembus persalinus]|uniref:Uncharacterized protein n=1 Tax=Pseudocohnilembus persalinus TaxID=266149 RepID=A0A0V0R5U6_PSEPJ|nr:hypothetical protein PPERSA_08621 [Pseudocohnilembus persalinus]|eukprot:KRX09589.1 hypothetical protein PPERSA_08621 [Pseudocohnilembus persalinus]